MKTVIKEHGIGLSIKRSKKQLFIEIAMLGKLTHEDYQTFVPLIDSALKQTKGLEVNLLVDMRSFRGWELLAGWDDLKFGVKHRNSFDKLALVGDKRWEEISVAMMQHLMRGECKFFKKRAKALDWLLAD